MEVDVCILGAGIIGLCTALALLQADPSLRVALLDRAAPCAGATGAGQGYLWLAHRDVGSPLFRLAAQSRAMWRELLAPAVPQLTAAAVEWQVRSVLEVMDCGVELVGCKTLADCQLLACLLAVARLALSLRRHLLAALFTRPEERSLQHPLLAHPFLCHAPQEVGSVLLASSAEEAAGLTARCEALAAEGLPAQLLTAAEARRLEPALQLPEQGAALLLPSDTQVNGRATAAALLRACEAHGGRFSALFGEGAVRLAAAPSGRVDQVQTGARRWGWLPPFAAWGL